MINDFVGTSLTLHTILALILNFKVTLGFLLFVVALGVIASFIGTYGARIR
jgi:hypothetical protein